MRQGQGSLFEREGVMNKIWCIFKRGENITKFGNIIFWRVYGMNMVLHGH